MDRLDELMDKLKRLGNDPKKLHKKLDTPLCEFILNQSVLSKLKEQGNFYLGDLIISMGLHIKMGLDTHGWIRPKMDS